MNDRHFTPRFMRSALFVGAIGAALSASVEATTRVEAHGVGSLKADRNQHSKTRRKSARVPVIPGPVKGTRARSAGSKT